MSVKRKSYDLDFKIRAVEQVEIEGKRAVAKTLGIDKKRIQEWCQQKQRLLSTVRVEGKFGERSRRKKLCGGGRKPQFENEEQELADRVIEQRSQHLRVTRRIIAEKAQTTIQ